MTSAPANLLTIEELARRFTPNELQMMFDAAKARLAASRTCKSWTTPEGTELEIVQTDGSKGDGKRTMDPQYTFGIDGGIADDLGDPEEEEPDPDIVAWGKSNIRVLLPDGKNFAGEKVPERRQHEQSVSLPNPETAEREMSAGKKVVRIGEREALTVITDSDITNDPPTGKNGAVAKTTQARLDAVERDLKRVSEFERRIIAMSNKFHDPGTTGKKHLNSEVTAFDGTEAESASAPPSAKKSRKKTQK